MVDAASVQKALKGRVVGMAYLVESSMFSIKRRNGEICKRVHTLRDVALVCTCVVSKLLLRLASAAVSSF